VANAGRASMQSRTHANYISGPLRIELTMLLRERLQAAGCDAGAVRVDPDDADADGQTLLIW